MTSKGRKRIAYHAAWYRRNRTKSLKQMALRYRKNRKTILKYAATYRYKNRKKIAQALATYYRKNRKRLLKQQIARQRKNHTKYLKYKAAYRRKNQQKIARYGRTLQARHTALIQRHKRQLAPRGIRGQPMSLDAHRKKLYFADGRERPCWYCLGENNKCGSGLDRLDNSISYIVKNTVPACRGCNGWRADNHTVQETRDHFKPMRDAAKI
jgi:hypothetical protein